MRTHTAGLVAAGVAAASLLIIPAVSGLDGKAVGRPTPAASSQTTSASPAPAAAAASAPPSTPDRGPGTAPGSSPGRDAAAPNASAARDATGPGSSPGRPATAPGSSPGDPGKAPSSSPGGPGKAPKPSPGSPNNPPGEPDVKKGRPGEDYTLPSVAVAVDVRGPVVKPVPGSRVLSRNTTRSGGASQEALVATARRPPHAVLLWYRVRLGQLGFRAVDVPVQAGTDGAGLRRGGDSVTVVASRTDRTTTTYSLLATIRSSETP